MSSYGTRRSSAIQMGAPSERTSYADFSPTASLSSSVGKSKRPTTMAKSRRLSSSTQSLRPASVPVSSTISRGRSVSVSIPDEEDDGEVTGRARRDKDKSLFECEKCSKVYRHSTCLTKHRWEHTSHWKEASKLLLSKHQQVQLLEGAAILAAASAGASLPDEKSYWPAAVSPPASGLLGSRDLGINIHALAASSPRFAPSSLLSDNGDFPSSRSEMSMDDDDSDDEDEGSSPAAEGLSLTMEEDEPLEDGMFDLDLGSADSPSPHLIPLPNLNPSSSGAYLGVNARPNPALRHVSPAASDSAASLSSSPGSTGPTRPVIRSTDSGFGSVSRSADTQGSAAEAISTSSQPKAPLLADSVTQAQWAQKYSEAQASGTRATKLEIAGSYDQAFQTYVQAAQAYLFLIRHTQDGETKAKLRAVSNKLVERAERIKQAKKGALGPAKKDRLALEEQDSVLAKSSLLDGQRLPRWSRDDANNIPHDPCFRRPALSTEQQGRGCVWKRGSEVLPGVAVALAETSGRSIQQDNVSDCSLIAALIISAEHHAKFGSKLGLSCLYPQNASGWPIASETGVYSARFRINGAWRKVSCDRLCISTSSLFLTTCLLAQICIDDCLPTSPEGDLMCASTSTHEELWPALIEKAYLSLSGSYDFHGSNSANDLYTLSGWLPEHIPLRSRFRSEQTWLRLSKGFQLGKCVLTVGTGKVLDEVLERAGLIPSHNYAVLDLRECNGLREVELMNPWVEPRSSWTSDLRTSLPGGTSRRTLVLSWEEIPIHFAAVHVNWDPTVFDHSDTAHLSVAKIHGDATTSPNRHCTSVKVHIDSDPGSTTSSDVWFFVARHSATKKETGEYLGMRVTRSVQDSEMSSSRPSVDEASTMIDDLYIFHRAQRSPESSAFDVVVSHEGPSSEFSFTLSVFSNDKIRIEEGAAPLPYTVSVQGSWSGSTAGGNHTRATFLYNPQYRITLSPQSNRPSATGDLELHAQTSKDSPINAKLVVSGGKRVGDFENRDVLAGAASYSYGRQSSRVSGLKPGTYTLVVSSFQPLHEDTFELSLHSSLPLQVTPIPPEGAGMYSRVVKGAWSDGFDADGEGPQENPTYKLEISRPTSIKFRLQTPERPLPVAVQVFSASTYSSHKPVMTSEPYSDLVCGAVTPLVKLEPSASGYLVIPSTFTPHTRASFVLFAYADLPIDLTKI
ncbi:hypothetical protein JCM16303_002018 [Sporobolomyces ruberrimus]